MSNSFNNIFGSKATNNDDGEHWLSVSDLMAGLMIVFLFIAIVFMRDQQLENQKIKDVAVTYQENQVNIYNSLIDEFEDDLVKWKATINDDLSFQFNSPDVLFDNGAVSLNPQFESILNDFSPRYLSILSKYKQSITEVRIEGHTSSRWNHNTPETEAYFRNMNLSQGRTRAVLYYMYNLDSVFNDYGKWIKSKFSAVGFSSSKLVLRSNGREDQKRSRRVTFRVLTNADVQIRKILEQ